MAALLAPSAQFPARHLVPALPLCVPLAALGMRRMPRLGTALAALSVAISAWLYVDARWGGGVLYR